MTKIKKLMGEMRADLERLNKSHTIKVDGQDKERLVFDNNQEVFKIFGEMDKGVLTPFNDYTYEWLDSFLSNVTDLMRNSQAETFEELEEEIQEQLYEWIDSEIDIYTSDLTEWLSHSNSNTYYLDEAAKEGNIDNLLMVAQGKAINEHFNLSLSILMKYLKSNYEDC